MTFAINKRKEFIEIYKKVKGEAIPVQAVKAHRVVRRRGSHISSRQSAHRWR
jgi:hypothetical protein